MTQENYWPRLCINAVAVAVVGWFMTMNLSTGVSDWLLVALVAFLVPLVVDALVSRIFQAEIDYSGYYWTRLFLGAVLITGALSLPPPFSSEGYGMGVRLLVGLLFVHFALDTSAFIYHDEKTLPAPNTPSARAPAGTR